MNKKYYNVKGSGDLKSSSGMGVFLTKHTFGKTKRLPNMDEQENYFIKRKG